MRNPVHQTPNALVSLLASLIGSGILGGMHCVAQLPKNGGIQWSVSRPWLQIDQKRLPASKHQWIAVKDPSIVRYQHRWHLFCTLRKNKQGSGRIRIGYLSFSDWATAKDSLWSVLDLTMGYHGAPQIFWFTPHKKWYLIYQAEDASRQLNYGPCFSTNTDIANPSAWTKPLPLYTVPQGVNAGLDFWVICDAEKAYLFFTTLNGKMWRTETRIESFPDQGWAKPELALQADIFEASHTYRLSRSQRFITVVEAQGSGRRYFKAFLADDLAGEWKPYADSRNQPFVSPGNVLNQTESWATSYSHGEFIRIGHNEKLQIDEHDLQLLFQGANDDEYRNRSYGQIPWRLGLLKQAKTSEMD